MTYSEWMTENKLETCRSKEFHEWFKDLSFWCMIRKCRTLDNISFLEPVYIKKEKDEAVYVSWSVRFGNSGSGYNMGGSGSIDLVPADCFLNGSIYAFADYLVERYSATLELKAEDITFNQEMYTLFQILNKL